MAMVRKFRGARANIVRPLGLVPKTVQVETPDEVEIDITDNSNLESLAVAGAPSEVVEEARLEDDKSEGDVELTEEQAEALQEAGAEIEEIVGVVIEDPEVEEVDVEIEIVDEPEDSEDVGEAEVPDPDDMTKAELRELAEKLGVDPEGRIDHLRTRVKRALKEG